MVLKELAWEVLDLVLTERSDHCWVGGALCSTAL